VSSCKEIVDLAFDYLQRELDPEVSRRLDQHLERCPSCINFLRTYECVPSLTREMLSERMPDSLRRSLHDFLRESIVPRNSSDA